MPTIEPFDGERTLPEGERLKLICKASGSPRPTLYWYRDGRRLEGSRRDDHRRDQPEPSPPPSRSRYIFRATGERQRVRCHQFLCGFVNRKYLPRYAGERVLGAENAVFPQLLAAHKYVYFISFCDRY